MKFIQNIKSFFVKLVISLALFLDKIEVNWIDEVLKFTDAIKKALGNQFVQIGLTLTKINPVVIEKFTKHLPDIQEKLSYLKINWDACGNAETDLKKIECFIKSIANAALKPNERNSALLQIALTLLEKIGVKVKGSFFSKELSVEARYNVLKKASKK